MRLLRAKPFKNLSQPVLVKTTALVLMLIGAGVAWGKKDYWAPAARSWLAIGGADQADGDDEDHPRHDEEENPDSLELSTEARRSLGLVAGKAKLGGYDRRITIPAMIVERPGQTRHNVVAPTTGVVENLRVIEGEAISPGDPLFQIRMTHKDLLQLQTEFIQSIGRLAVEQEEIDRIQGLADKGIVPEKQLLQHEYEKKKIMAVLRAQREALRLHGLSPTQVATIEKGVQSRFKDSLPNGDRPDDEQLKRNALVPNLPVFAPSPNGAVDEPRDASPGTSGSYSGTSSEGPLFVVHHLAVEPGQHVQAGDELCTLVDLSRLYIEGKAFEQEVDEILNAAGNDEEVTARLVGDPDNVRFRSGLKIVRVANRVDSESRALKFYVGLPNRIVRDEQRSGRRFVTWLFQPGQRMELSVPVEHWTDRIVLPADAVARDGLESYVFVQNGNYFQRQPVEIVHRDKDRVVVAPDESLLGKRIVQSGAHRLLMALKKKAGGGSGGHPPHGHHHHH